jgi:hypothetical protein
VTDGNGKILSSEVVKRQKKEKEEHEEKED